jgi:small nuclear ribonucleoprotein (snRNP)-like protein
MAQTLFWSFFKSLTSADSQAPQTELTIEMKNGVKIRGTLHAIDD